ncbi:hypothetical protein D918_09317 [Trichuris suis]|nr:hypothetical protein D918_09317 [Trichuris suis]
MIWHSAILCSDPVGCYEEVKLQGVNSSQLYNALAPAGRWPSNAGETGYIDVAGRAGLLVPSLLTNWETTAAAAGGWLTATGSPSLVFQQAPTSVQQALFDLRLPRWVSSGCWSAVDLASPPLITAGRTFIPSVADLHRLSVHLNQLFAVKNFPSGIADVSSAIIPSSGVRGELPA